MGRRSRHLGVTLKVAGAVIAVAVAAALIWAVVGGRFSGTDGGTGGIDVTVVSDHHICSGPSRDATSIGVVSAGDGVVVDCLEQGWARLDEPSRGGHVSREGLQFEEPPPPC